MFYYRRLRDLREDKDLTQADVVKFLGTAREQYNECKGCLKCKSGSIRDSPLFIRLASIRGFYFRKSPAFVLTNGIFGIECVEILLIELLLRSAKDIAESLEVHYLTLTKKLDNVADVGIVGETENVIVGDSRLLLC